jgi:FeS assembly SUF system protein
MAHISNNTPLTDLALEQIKTCFDPEIPVNIYELGLIYEVMEADGIVDVKMTLTSPNCPAAESLPGEVQTKIAAIEGVKEAKVEVVFDPTWDKEMMSEEAKLELGFW